MMASLELNRWNPVALPSREARVGSFTIEAGRRMTKERWVNVFERIDADDGVKALFDPAGDDRDYAAPGADVELRRPGAECVAGHEGAIVDGYR
jgi:hypothetical protein